MYSNSILIGTYCDSNRSKESMTSMFVDEFFDIIRSDRYHNEQRQIKHYRGVGMSKKAQEIESSLPLFYPTTDFTCSNRLNRFNHNGIAIINIRCDDSKQQVVIMTELTKLPYVKGYYVNTRGTLTVLVVISQAKDSQQFREKRSALVEHLSKLFPGVLVSCRARIIRALMICYCPFLTFVREDKEIEAYKA